MSTTQGRSAAQQLAARLAAERGDHVHVVGRTGVWCVTVQPIGLLYARLPRRRDQ